MKIHWTEETRLLLLPRADRDLPAFTPLTPEDCTAALSAALPKLKLSGKETPMAAAAFTDAVARLERQIAGAPPGTVEEEARLLSLIAQKAPKAEAALIDRWFAGPGAAFALEVWLGSLAWQFTLDHVWVHDTEANYWTKLHPDHVARRCSVYLRRRLCGAPRDIGALFAATAAAGSPGGLNVCRAVGLGWHVPESGWVEAACQRLLKASGPERYEHHLPHPHLHVPLIAGCQIGMKTAIEVAKRTMLADTSSILNLMDRFQEASWPILSAWLTAQTISRRSDAAGAMRLLDMLESPEDLRCLPELLQCDRCEPVRRLLQSDPAKSLRALYACAGATGEARPPIHAMIHGFLDADPSLENLTGLDPEARAQQSRLLQQRRHGYAPPADLPDWMQSPPWKKSGKQAGRSTPRQKQGALALTPLVLPPEITEIALKPFTRYAWKEYDARKQREIVDTFHTFININKKLESFNLADLMYCDEETQRAFFRPETVPCFYGPTPSAYNLGGLRWQASVWLGWAGADVLPLLLALVPLIDSGEMELVQAFGHSTFAPIVLNIYARRRRERKAALAWMLRFPAHAAAALIPRLLGKGGRDADRTMRPLWAQAQETVRRIARQYEAESGLAVEAEIEAKMAIDPMEILPASMPKLTEKADQVPPLRLKTGKFLSAGAMEVALLCVRLSSMDDPYAGLERLREICTAESLGDLALALWSPYTAGSDWAAAAFLGDDRMARKLGQFLRTDRKPTDAVINNVLRALLLMGSDSALIELGRLSERALKEKVRQKAKDLLKELATDRGLSEEELGDRLVPDLDLEADGGMILDFGPRQFRVGLTETLSPFLTGSDGQRLARFPAANKQDDKDKVKDATARWKTLVKNLEGIASTQISRIERAMCEARAWDHESFLNLFLRHPLLQHLGRRLLWSAVTEDVQIFFRIAEDGSFADRDDNPVDLPEECSVTLPHPADMRPDDIAAWGQIFSDYQILQPFPQIGRPVYTIREEERERQDLKERLQSIEAPASMLLGVMDRAGWRKGGLEYGTHLDGWFRTVEGQQLSIAAEPQIAMDALSTLHRIALYTRGTFGGLSKRAFSELVRPLEGMKR